MSWGSSKVIGEADVPVTCVAHSWTCGRAMELWLPLLLLNGASAATGQRLITTVLDPTYTDPASCPTEAPKGSCRLN